MNSTLASIKNVLQTFPYLELALLIGSQEKKDARPGTIIFVYAYGLEV